MPTTVNIERHKLNLAMYQKLKKYIMNKRKREQQERAQDAIINKLKREREEHNKQATVERESLEQIRRDAAAVKRKIDEMKLKRDELYKRLKQIAHEESSIHSTIKEDLLHSIPSSQFGNQAMIPSQQKSAFIQTPSTQVASSSNQASSMNSNILSALTSFLGPNGLNAEHLTMLINQGIIDPSILIAQSKAQQPVAQLGSLNEQLQALQSQMRPANMTQSQHEFVATRHPPATPSAQVQSQANLAKFLLLNKQVQGQPRSTNDLTVFKAQQQQQQQQQQLMSRPAPNKSSNALGMLGQQPTSVGSTLLPPAPVSYRGSITTGQSAQQIQFQQHAAASAVKQPPQQGLLKPQTPNKIH
ncbi:hypothetical protein Ciccas_013227, partial [Cichlidogyrus casuarinus]